MFIIIAGFFPLIISYIASIIAQSLNCGLHEGFAQKCMLLNNDIGETLYGMVVFGWLTLATMPFIPPLCIVWTIYFVWTIISKKKQLTKAATRGDASFVQFLISTGTNVNTRDKSGNTGLMISSSTGNVVLVNLFLENGANPLLRNNRGQNAVDQALQNEHDNVAKIIRQAIQN